MLPICFIVDDSEPVINPLYYCEQQVRKNEVPRQQSGELVERTIPLEMIERFSTAIRRHRVRGKFSVIPYPAGLGSIIDGWEGADQREIEAWLKIAREQIQPLMDISPEMLTHTMALDLATRQPLGESEQEWSHKQTVETLLPYITYALELLKKAGFDATGVTSPWNFAKMSEAAYAQAIFTAEQTVYGRKLSWYFLDIDDVNLHGVQSHVYYRDGSGGAVVHIVSKCADFFWPTMESRETSEEYIREIADHYLDRTGKSGRLSQLYDAGVPIVFHTHWQSLYSNGRYTGQKALELIFERIERNWAGSGKVQWMKCSELARQIA